MRVPISRALHNHQGFSLTELLVITAIMAVLFTIGANAFVGMQERYRTEQQVKEMHADIMSARARARLRNRIHFVTVTANTYQVTEDTNESGGVAPNAGDIAFFTAPKQLKYSSSWNGTIVLDTNGIISDPANPNMSANNPLQIQFSTSNNPEYDCILLSPTRINEGKWNGTASKCDPK